MASTVDPWTKGGGLGESTPLIENPDITFDSTVGPSHTQIQLTTNRKQYFQSAVGWIRRADYIYLKKSAYKCTHAIQTFFVQRTTVFAVLKVTSSAEAALQCPLGPGFWLQIHHQVSCLWFYIFQSLMCFGNLLSLIYFSIVSIVLHKAIREIGLLLKKRMKH